MSRKRRVPITDEQIVQAYGRLRSGQKIAKEFGASDAVIYRALAKAGVQTNGLQEYRQTMGDPKPGPYIGVYKGSSEDIVAWYQAGDSIREIANRIGRSTHVVTRRLKAAGVVRRPWQGGGSEHSMWTGGTIDDGNGYKKTWVSDDDPLATMRNIQGYVLEHRLNLARKLGRPLLPTETVHHIDGDRSNNAPDNLQLRQGNHGKHVVMCCRDCGSQNIGPMEISNGKSPRDGAPRVPARTRRDAGTSDMGGYVASPASARG